MALNEYLPALHQIRREAIVAMSRATKEGNHDDAADLAAAVRKLESVMDVFVQSGR